MDKKTTDILQKKISILENLVAKKYGGDPSDSVYVKPDNMPEIKHDPKEMIASPEEMNKRPH